VTYAEAVARLTALRGGEHAGMRPGLERIEALLAALGHPERRYRLVQIGGTNAGVNYDQLVVTGNTTLNGTLTISLVNGFRPNGGDTFEIIKYASHTGSFDNISGRLNTMFDFRDRDPDTAPYFLNPSTGQVAR